MRTHEHPSAVGTSTSQPGLAENIDLPPVFGCSDLARFLSVDIKTVQGLAQRKEIPCRKVGKAYRFYRPAVLSWLLGAPGSRPRQQ